MKDGWKIVKTDGNPTEPGTYDVVIIYPKWDSVRQCRSDKMLAERTSRWFGEAKENHGWLMEGQPREGLAWTEECGSYDGEQVYAWLPVRGCEVPLPEGVKWA